LEEQAKAAKRSLKIDRSCKQEDDSQLWWCDISFLSSWCGWAPSYSDLKGFR
jgi:hypothetical protein